jgi:DNA-binding response OmpR family regulator
MDGPYVLVVDDDALVRETIAQVLALEEIAAELAPDVPNALELARRRRPAVVLLDYYLPGMNGDAFCRGFAADPGRAGTRIVVLTAAEQDLATIRAHCGADDLIRKPFGIDELLTAMRRALGA